MEELFEKLSHNSQQIKAIQNAIDNTKVLPYYDLFNVAEQRQTDLKRCFSKMKDVLNKRHTLLENIQLEATKELGMLSELQRNTTLQKIKGCEE